jgi:hypothetical protein
MMDAGRTVLVAAIERTAVSATPLGGEAKAVSLPPTAATGLNLMDAIVGTMGGLRAEHDARAGSVFVADVGEVRAVGLMDAAGQGHPAPRTFAFPTPIPVSHTAELAATREGTDTVAAQAQEGGTKAPALTVTAVAAAVQAAPAPATTDAIKASAAVVHLTWTDLYREGASLLDVFRADIGRPRMGTLATGKAAEADIVATLTQEAPAETATVTEATVVATVTVSVPEPIAVVTPVTPVIVTPAGTVTVQAPAAPTALASPPDVLVIRTPADVVKTMMAIIDFTWGGRHDLRMSKMDVIAVRTLIDANPVVAGADRVVLSRGADTGRDPIMLMPGVAIISVDAISPTLLSTAPVETLQFQLESHAAVTLVGVIDI